MIIAISGSVGSGKSTISKRLAEKLGFELINLNDMAFEFKINEVEDLQTFDFDIDALIHKMNRFIADNKSGDYILEGHFAHFLNPELVDYLFVINRNLKDLRAEYEIRGYNEQKIKDNLEVESFNLCFYEGIEEGYKEEEQIFCLENSSNIDNLVKKIVLMIDLEK